MYTSVYASMILPMYVPRRSTLMRGFATSSNAGTGSGDALTSSNSLSSAAPTVRSSSAGYLDIATRSETSPSRRRRYAARFGDSPIERSFSLPRVGQKPHEV